MSQGTRAVVLGGGLAGTLAATALARQFDSVTIVERDTFPPPGPEFRKGVPQARHAHLLMSGGARIIETLLPGTEERLLELGAHRVGIPQQAVWLTAYGWQHRFPETQFIISAGRPLLDWVIRDLALRERRISILPDTEALDPIGDAGRITGVGVRHRESGEIHSLSADFVVDATGRGSAASRWLSDLGLPPVTQDTVDSGIAYATRLFRAPLTSTQFPIVNVLSDHRVPRPGRNASLAPIEDGRWIVTLSGTRGAEMPTDGESFTTYARSVRHPVIAELIEHAEPISEVYATRSTANRRLFYELMPHWPDGLVVLGDAVAAFNPVYGHGMSVAARSVAALGAGLAGGHGPGTAAAIQRAIGAAADDAWLLASSQDLCYPDCRSQLSDPRLSADVRSQQRSFSDLVGSAALREPVVSAAAAKVTTLSEPISSLQSPQVIAALRRGGGRPALTAPPLTEAETTFLRPVITAGHETA